ncbi:MAG TPA: beta-ketoacyl-[acyl-carrier-protein] synthase family protein [Vicinamibacteria bacterium]|jgi:3-oxoacyl-[acyl-carrier-protein] synthase II
MKRVAITGIGVVTPIGIGVDAFWDALMEGRSGIRPIASFDTSAFPRHYGGEVLDFRPEDHLPADGPLPSGRATQMALAAGHMAVRDAGLEVGTLRLERCGVVMGTTVGDADTLEGINAAWRREGPEAAPGPLFRGYPYHMSATSLGAEFGFGGIVAMLPNACSAGNHAIGCAFDHIADGAMDVVLAGGADSFSRTAFLGFMTLRALAPDHCRPFDRGREGMVVSEGAAILVLESLDHARRRGARVYAEVASYGLACDAYHITGPDPEARGAVAAIGRALEGARIDPARVDYVSAHGTGTPANDKSEAVAMHRVFGERGRRVPISSVKSMIGHTMGTAAAIEAAVCALAITRSAVPPTINYETPDPECDLDCVPNEARAMPVRVALSNSFAFGGNCSCLALSALEGTA